MSFINVGAVQGTIRLRDEFTAALNRASSRIMPFVVKAELMQTALSKMEKHMKVMAATPSMRSNAVGYAQAAAAIRMENVALEENLNAIRRGPVAFAALNREKEIYNRLTAAGVVRDSAAGRQIESLIVKQQRMREEIQRLSYTSKANTEVMAQSGRQLAEVGRRITMSIGLPIALLGGLAIKTAKDFEASFAGIRKTIIATEDEYADLANKMRELAKRIPVNVNELNAIGQVAGQLNIAKENIVEFTEVMAGLGFATNLTATEAAEALARLTNITNTPQRQIKNLASAVVALGNGFQGAARTADGLSGKLATTEAEVVEMATRFAAAGNISGLTAAQILGIAAAVTSVGVEAELGGTAIQKMLLNVNTSVVEGDKNLRLFASVSKMSAKDFADAWRSDPMATFVTFVKGIQAQGDKAFATLKNLNFEDQRLIRTFISLAAAGDLLGKATDYATDSFQKNTAWAREVQQRYSTFASQLQVTWQNVKDVAITIGNSLIPVLRDTLVALKPVIEGAASLAQQFLGLPKEIRATALAFGAFLVILGPVLTALGNLKVLYAAILTYAPKILSALGPVGVVLTIIATAVTALSAAIKAAANEMQKDMDRMVVAANKTGLAYQALRDQIRNQAAGGTAFLPPEQVKAMEDELKSIGTQADNLKKKIADITRVDDINRRIGQGSKGRSKVLAGLEAELVILNREAEKLRASIEAAKGAPAPTVKPPPTPDPDAAAMSEELAKAIANYTKEQKDSLATSDYFNKMLTKTGGNFEIATLHAKVFGEVLKIINPNGADGQRMMEWGLAAATAADNIDKARKASEDWWAAAAARGSAAINNLLDAKERQAAADAKIIQNAEALQSAAKQHIRDLDLEVYWAQKYAVAAGEGAVAVRELAIAQEVATRVTKFYDLAFAKTGITLEEFTAKVEESVRALFDATDAAKWAEQFQAIEDKFSDDLLDGFVGAFTDAFAEILRTGEFTWKKLADSLKDAFIDALAEMLKEWIKTQAKMAAWKAATGAATGSGGTDWGAIAGKAAGSAASSSASGAGGAGTAWAWYKNAMGGSAQAWGAIAGAAIVAYMWQRGLSMSERNYGKQFGQGTGTTSLVGTGIVRGGGFGEIGTQIGDGIANILRAIQNATGQLLTSMPAVAARIRNDGEWFRVYVANTLIGSFKDMNEAIIAGAKAVFEQSNLANVLDPIIANAIRTFKGKAEEFGAYITDLQSMLDKARGLSEVAIALRNVSVEAANLKAALTAAGMSMVEASALAWEGSIRSMMAIRNQITGQTMSRKEELEARKADAVLWNAKFLLLKAELQAERDALAYRIELFKARMNGEKVALEVEKEFLIGRGNVLKLDIEQKNAWLKAAEAQLLVFDKLLEEFAKIDLILPGEIKIPNINIGKIGGIDKINTNFGKHIGNFGKAVNEFKEAQKALAEAIHDIMFKESATALTDRERLTMAYSDFQSNISAARGGSLTAVQALPEMLNRLLELAKAFTGGGNLGMFGFDTFGNFFDAIIAQAQGIVDMKAPGKIREGKAVYDERLNETARELLKEGRKHREQDGIQAHIFIDVAEGTNQRLGQLIKSVDRLGRRDWTAA